MAGPYEVELTIPATTPETAPASVDLEIEGDVVTRVELDYPAGCHYLVGTAVYYGIRQLWPVEAGTWFRANKYVIGFEPDWDMPERTVTLTFKGCAPLSKYAHTIRLRVVTEDLPAARPWLVQYDFTLLMRKLIGF